MTGYKTHESHSIDMLQQAAIEHGDGLHILTGYDTESPLILHLAKSAGIARQILTIDTGFWFDETYQYRRSVEAFEGVERSSVTAYSPSIDDVERIHEEKLWQHDLKEYNRITKIEPLGRAVRELGITALVTGVRASQTNNRSVMQERATGNDGETRINAVLQWPDQAVQDYFEANNLPEHPLISQGYGSVGDWPITVQGVGRSGRLLGDKSECGLHLSD